MVFTEFDGIKTSKSIQYSYLKLIVGPTSQKNNEAEFHQPD